MLKGRAGEAMSRAEAVAAGETILAEHVTFVLPSGARSRPDLLTETASGALKVREAKFGPNAELTGQRASCSGPSSRGGAYPCWQQSQPGRTEAGSSD